MPVAGTCCMLKVVHKIQESNKYVKAWNKQVFKNMRTSARAQQKVLNYTTQK